MKRKSLFYMQLALTLAMCLFLIAPVFMSVLAGLTENYFKGISSGLTLKWIFEVFELYSGTIWLSLKIALVCLVINLLIGIPAAYVLASVGGRLARIIEEIIVLPIAIPGLAIALALILTYGGFTDFRRGWAFILVGHVLYTLPFMVRSVLAVLHSVNFVELEESAASLGASFPQRFLGVIVPNIMPGIMAGSLMTFTLSIGEFNLTWMLHTPITKTLPVGLADSYASMCLEVASAYTLIFFFMIVPLLIAMQAMNKR